LCLQLPGDLFPCELSDQNLEYISMKESQGINVKVKIDGSKEESQRNRGNKEKRQNRLRGL
jgi:hypothetical protein